MSYSVSSVLTNPLNFFERFKPPIGNLSSTKICGIAVTIIASLGALYYLLSKSLFLEKEINWIDVNNKINFISNQEPFTKCLTNKNKTTYYQGSQNNLGKIFYWIYPNNKKRVLTRHKIEISNQELTWGPINLSDGSYDQYVIRYKQNNPITIGYILNNTKPELSKKEESRAQRLFVEDIEAIYYLLNQKPTIEAKPSSS